MLSDTVGQRIAFCRKELGWNRERLAEECARSGMPELTAAAIANIEGGRRQSGVRRRTITIDEIVGIAYVMRISPMVLLISYPEEGMVDVTPNIKIKPSDFLDWMTAGNTTFYFDAQSGIGLNHESSRHAYNFYNSKDDTAQDNNRGARLDFLASPAIAFLRKYGEVIRQRLVFSHLVHIVPEAEVQNIAAKVEQLDRQIIDLTSWGWPVPELPDELSYLEGKSRDEYDRDRAMSTIQIAIDPQTPASDSRQSEG